MTGTLQKGLNSYFATNEATTLPKEPFYDPLSGTTGVSR